MACGIAMPAARLATIKSRTETAISHQENHPRLVEFSRHLAAKKNGWQIGHASRSSF
jgi:hypothetical protein